MPDDNESNSVTCQIEGDSWATVTYTQDEIAGYIFAGMKAMNALDKWGNEEVARRVARGFAAALMPGNLSKKFYTAGQTGLQRVPR